MEWFLWLLAQPTVRSALAVAQQRKSKRGLVVLERVTINLPKQTITDIMVENNHNSAYDFKPLAKRTIPFMISL
ncbi:MAG: hypothetical protein KDE56_10570 [Anaerolineales bacterium]|nr:hypothetical protein [Anaerolineales bacterium]